MPPFTRLVVSNLLLEGVIEHAHRELPNECCGLIVGIISERIGYAVECVPIRNDLASPTCYLTNARDLFEAYRAMRAAGTEVLAVYHSHPTSDPVPSCRDRAENSYGETVAHVIVSLTAAEPVIRAWWIAESGYHGAELACY
jgi:proteasome lid subunit RPN8/RPN11